MTQIMSIANSPGVISEEEQTVDKTVDNQMSEQGQSAGSVEKMSMKSMSVGVGTPLHATFINIHDSHL